MNNKVLSLISMATRARKTATGEFAVEKAVKEGKAKVVIVANDSSDRSKKMYKNMCEYRNIPLYFYGTKEELGKYTGHELRGSVAVIDEGFVKALVEQLNLDNK